MALGDSYASVSDLEARLGTSDPGTYTSLLDAASRSVEAFCQRQFNTDNVATARLFDADDAEFLAVDDFHTLAGLAIEVDGDPWDLADVDPRPRNGIVNGQIGWPYFQLFSVDRCWPLWKIHQVAISVTAQWGWAAVPEGIRLATLDVAAVMSYGSGSETAGPVRSESIDGYSVGYSNAGLGDLPDNQAPPELRKAIAYRRHRHGIA